MGFGRASGKPGAPPWNTDGRETENVSESEALVNGSGHADKLGAVVTVDIEGECLVGTPGGLLGKREHRTIICGVLTSAEDIFALNDDISSTILVVGGRLVVLDWSETENLSATIELA